MMIVAVTDVETITVVVMSIVMPHVVTIAMVETTDVMTVAPIVTVAATVVTTEIAVVLRTPQLVMTDTHAGKGNNHLLICRYAMNIGPSGSSSLAAIVTTLFF